VSSSDQQRPRGRKPVTGDDHGKDWASDDAVRHTKEDAITERQFEQMVQATYRMDDDYFARECRLVLFACGRLGMRPGEVAHMKADWVNWEDERIEIPKHEPCTDGRTRDICGHCRGAAEQMADIRTANTLDDHYQSLGRHDVLEPGGHVYELFVDAEPFYAQMWSPKTVNAARKIPYAEASTRAALAVEDYFTHYDEFEASRGVVNRRVDRMARQTESVDVDEIYPHALRATAASYYAARGLSAMDLKALFGWSQFSTAIAYIEESPERLEDALQQLRH
jgi:integrase